MAIIVSALGVVIAVIGAIGVASPHRLIVLLDRLQSPARFWLAVTTRAVFGAVFLAVAPDCRLPLVVQVVGVMSLVAALGMLAMGRERLDAFIGWWLSRSPTLFRLWATAAIAFGVLLVYAGP